MVDYTTEFTPIVERAIAAFSGLIHLYEQDEPNDEYFDKCLSEARTHRRELQLRLDDAKGLVNIPKSGYSLTLYHFLESHRGEYGPDMPKPNSTKAQEASHYLKELQVFMDAMSHIRQSLAHIN